MSFSRHSGESRDPRGAASAIVGPGFRRDDMRRRPLLLHPAAKPLLFVACLLPFVWLLHAAIADTLGANPAEALIRRTGDWTLRFLCLTLAVTPLRE